MRIISYILMAAGILLLADAAFDQIRGRTAAPAGGIRYGIGIGSLFHDSITRESNPEDFRNAMRYHWFYASMILAGGFVALLIDRGQDKVDPMSADSDPNIAAELKQDEMGEQQTKDGIGGQ